MEKIKCPSDILYEKEWRAAYGNRCNAIFLSNLMHDGESMRKLFHNEGGTHSLPVEVQIFYEYYKDHDKEKMLNRIEEVTTDNNGYVDFYLHPFHIDGYLKNKTLQDNRSSLCAFYGGTHESSWADLSNYEKRATMRVTDEFSSGQSVYYDNKSVAEVLKDTVEKTTFLEKKIEEPTKNEQLDLLVRNLIQNRDEKLHIPTYAKALKLINNDLTSAFEQKTEPLEADAYVPVIIMLDEMSANIFNQIDYKQQRTFHKSDLGQEMLKFSYLTTQNMFKKGNSYNGFSADAMNAWLSDIKNTDLWQVAQRKITEAIVERWAHRVEVGSLLNNRMMELATIKPKPKEAMYADYWQEDMKRSGYMNLYVKPQNIR
ncbi:MAG: hypothetical protein IJ525_07000 [Alphaproteobacteria bacterium]|nr:hypothetical protein [Alphaproteobacteria bacterium]